MVKFEGEEDPAALTKLVRGLGGPIAPDLGKLLDILDPPVLVQADAVEENGAGNVESKPAEDAAKDVEMASASGSAAADPAPVDHIFVDRCFDGVDLDSLCPDIDEDAKKRLRGAMEEVQQNLKKARHQG